MGDLCSCPCCVLTQVRFVTFDKTGTLTLGSFRIIHEDLGFPVGAASSTTPVTEQQPAAAEEGGAAPHPSLRSSTGGSPIAARSGAVGETVSPRVGMDGGEVLRLVGSLERGASHHIASVIVGRAAAQASCRISSTTVIPC